MTMEYNDLLAMATKAAIAEIRRQRGADVSNIDKVEIFKDSKSQWRWRGKAHGNHEIVTQSEDYHNKKDAVSAAHKAFPDAEVRVFDPDLAADYVVDFTE